MPGPAFLRGERVSLHPIEEDDLEFLQEHRNAQEIRQPLTDSHPRNGPQMEDDFENSGNGDGLRLLICIDDDDPTDAGEGDATDAGDDDGADAGEGDATDTGDEDDVEARDDEETPTEANDDEEDGLTRVGEIGIPWVRQPHGVGMLMYWVAPDHQGNGYVTEATELVLDHAFCDMRLNRVWAMVIGPNEASQHVLQKVGFEREGVDRQGTFIDGEYVDNHRFGVLAEDWLDE